ncbi:M24 family metallopeptidase [soil metagenome]
MRDHLDRLQSAVRTSGLDAWVLYDFRGSNTLAWNILKIAPDAHCTRRWMIVIPAKGKTVKIVHTMEKLPLDHIRTDTTIVYDTHGSWDAAVRSALAPFTSVALEYSPMGALPIISKVDGGTVEWLKSFVPEVVSSADLLQEFTSVLNEDQIAGNAITAALLRRAVMNAFRLIRSKVQNNNPVTEYEVQQHILHEFEIHNLITDHPPIVAIGPNASSPHYAPTIVQASNIERDMIVLIDAWVRSSAPGSVYADITWVGYTGSVIPEEAERLFSVITAGRDAALHLVRERFEQKIPLYGFEVDQACRSVIDGHGNGPLFIHRTGHNITDEVHGPGTNMDDFETHDNRRVLPGTSFSIEPGVYIQDTLGLRTEIDVVISLDGVVAVPSEPIQTSILPLLAEADPTS